MKFIISIIFLVLVTGCSEKETEKPLVEKPPVSQPKKNTKEDVIKFWQLVAQGELDNVLNLANSLIKENSGKVDDYYKSLFKQEGIKETFLSRKNFNEVDAFFWLQAQQFNQISLDVRIKSDKSKLIKSIYSLVREKILKKGNGADISAYPMHIWQRGFGVCDRQAWVFCEIAYQLGANTSVIYLMDPEKGVSPHTICEIEYEGTHYIIDTLYDKFLPEKTFADLTDAVIREVWNDRPELFDTFKKAVRQIPSMPTDYSERNQRLSARLGKSIRFGEPPQNRYHFWKGVSPNMDTRFWGYPIRLLKVMKFYQDAEK